MSLASQAADAREQAPRQAASKQAKRPGAIGSPGCGCTSPTSTG